ncbi:MAG: hypothetical protein AAF513_15540 [Pseudomonadota bacterium]
MHHHRARALKWSLWTKIGITCVLWSGPLLLLPRSVYDYLGFPALEPLVYFDLLGMSFAALVLAYTFGLRILLRGVYPDQTVWVGILSNGGRGSFWRYMVWLGLGQSGDLMPKRSCGSR